MFWLYGGGYINGCADWWPQYWMDEDIVVIVANYRIGPFGFLGNFQFNKLTIFQTVEVGFKPL